MSQSWPKRARRAEYGQGSEPEMIYLATGLIVVWSVGLFFLVGRALNFTRLILNNVAPGTDYWGSTKFFRFNFLGFKLSWLGTAIDPANLSEVGRQYQKKAIRNEWITFAWGIGGVILLAWASSYFMER
jgi:hypothetical protein